MTKCFTIYRLFLIGLIGISSSFFPLFGQSQYDWGVSMGSMGRDEITDLSIDSDGNIYVTGIFEDSIDASNGTNTHIVKSNGWRDGLIAKYSSNGDIQWAFNFGNFSWDRGWAITADDQGNVYTGGVFSNKVDFDPSSDSTFLLSNPEGVWPDGYLAKYDTDGNLQWAKHLLTARDRSASQTATLLGIQSMEIDNNGDLIIGGMFWDTVWLSPSVMLVSDGPLRDMFLAKYDSDGNLIWGKQMGGAADQEIRSVAVDLTGNIYATGYFFGNAYFDMADPLNTISSEGSGDVFLAKYTSSGSLEWVHGFGSADGSTFNPEGGNDVGVDDQGNVFMTGVFYGPIDFDPSANVDSLYSSSSTNVFTVKFSSQGDYLWAFSLNGQGQLGKNISVQSDGSFTLAGEHAGKLDLDPSSDSMMVFALGANDLFFANYTSNAEFISGRNIRGLSNDELHAMESTESDIVIGGLFFQSILLDQQSGDLRFSKGDADIFLAKYREQELSIRYEGFDGEYQIFPNPATSTVNIYAKWSNQQTATLSLRTIQGQLLQSWELPHSQEIHLTLERNTFPQGLYLLELRLPDAIATQTLLFQ